MRVLFLASSFPFPPLSGTDVSAAELIRELAGRPDIELSVGYFSTTDAPSTVPGATLIRLPHRSSREAPGILVPRGLRRYYSSRARRVLQSVQPDLIIAHRLHTAYVAVGLPARRVLVLQDVISAKTDQFLSAPSPVQRTLSAHYRLVERWALGQFERIYVVSAAERDNVKRFHSRFLSRTFVARMGFQVHEGRANDAGQPRESDIIYFGNLASGRNQRAARRAARIVGATRAFHPRARAVAIGAGASAEVCADLRDAGFDFVGEVSDPDVHLRRSKVLLNPQQTASGVKTSVLRGMGLGMACAVSPPIADGIGGSPGRDYEVCESDEDFVLLLTSLLDDPSRRRELGEAAAAYAGRTFTWAAYADALLGVET
jgi:glycosyltransferase involved in cell wall biosynthesis